MKKAIRYCFILVFTSLCGFVHAADIEAGKEKAAICAACHGLDGISTQPTYPNLRGQKKLYLIRQLQIFRDGRRPDPFMTPIVKPLTDDDIENIAEYYSSLK